MSTVIAILLVLAYVLGCVGMEARAEHARRLNEARAGGAEPGLILTWLPEICLGTALVLAVMAGSQF